MRDFFILVFSDAVSTAGDNTVSGRVGILSNLRLTGAVEGGPANKNLSIRGNFTATDPTAWRIALYALDPATDTFYTVAQIVPNAANPFFTVLAPDAAPTTTVLDVNNVTWRYTPAGALVAYVNNADVIKSLSLGTPA